MPVLRLYVSIMLILFALVFLQRISEQRRDFFVFFQLLTHAVLFLYLRLPGLKSLFGRYYLPLALGIAVMGPILAEGLPPIIRLYLRGQDPATINANPDQLIIWMMVPFLIVATQYTLRTMLIFTGFCAILPWLISLFAAPIPGYADLNLEQAIARLLVFGLFGFVTVRLTAGEREQRRVLADKNAELANYAATLEELAITQERNRLARELHDTLAHTLSAVNIQLKALEALWETDPAAAKSRLTQMQAITRNGLNDARRALQELRARPIEELGLAMAIRRLIQQAAERAGFVFQISIPPEFRGLTPSIEQQVYRIAEEALNNIVRHAEAKRVILLLEKERQSLRLMIKDNGVGFDIDRAGQNGHYGLIGMRERADLIQGRLSVESEPGEGTTLDLRVPV